MYTVTPALVGFLGQVWSDVYTKCKDHNNLKNTPDACFLVLTDQFVFSGLWLAEVAFETNWKAHLNHCELQKHLAHYYLICWRNLLRRKALTNNLLNQGFEMHLLFCNPLHACESTETLIQGVWCELFLSFR